MESHTFPVLKELSGEYQISTSSPIWLDIMPRGTNKGYAIKFLQEKFKVLPEETMVFGDYLNDLEMMHVAEYSYAMDNAHSTIKAVARYSTLSNDDEGVVFAIEAMLDK